MTRVPRKILLTGHEHRRVSFTKRNSTRFAKHFFFRTPEYFLSSPVPGFAEKKIESNPPKLPVQNAESKVFTIPKILFFLAFVSITYRERIFYAKQSLSRGEEDH